MNGVIFDIQRFSIDDGPGIRTTVFLKGCSLRCLWCHNPEGLQTYPEIMFFPQKCIGCGKCFLICPQKCHTTENGNHVFLREDCLRCGKCAEACYSGALTVSGKIMAAQEVAAEIEKDEMFYENSGGGVTFSGGEPLLQAEFLREVMVICKNRGYHCAVETAGNVAWSEYEKIIPYTDLFLYDIKAVDEALHREATGTGNRRIIENLRKLAQEKPEIWVRTPEIPGVNDTLEEKEKLSALLKELKTVKNHVYLPYHRLGESKYESLGLPLPVIIPGDNG